MQIHKDKVDLRLPAAGGGGGEMRNYCLMLTEFLFRCDGKVLEVDNSDVLCFFVCLFVLCFFKKIFAYLFGCTRYLLQLADS